MDELLEFLAANPWAASLIQADIERPPAERQLLTTADPPRAATPPSRGTQRPGIEAVRGFLGRVNDRLEASAPETPQAPTGPSIGPREGNRFTDLLGRLSRTEMHPVIETVKDQLAADLEYGPGAIAEIGPLKIAGRTIRRALGNGKHLDINVAGDRFVATIDGRQAAVGTIGRQGDQAFVQDLLVPEAMRRQGIGRAVFEGLDEATGGLVPNPGVKSPGGEAVEQSFFNARQAGDAAAPPPEMLTLRHYGPEVEGLPYLDPTRHGTGQAGAEARRRADYADEYLPRTFFYEEGAQVEPRFQGQPSVEVQIPRSAIASGEDVQAAARQASEELGEPGGPGVVTRAERILQGQGFEGYSHGGVVQKFTPTPLADRPFLGSIYDPENPARFFMGLDHADAENQIARSLGIADPERGLTAAQQRRVDEARAGMVEGFYDTRGRTNLTRDETGARLKQGRPAHSDNLREAGVDDIAARMIAGEDGGFTLNPTTGESAAGRDAWAVAPRKDTEKVFTRPPTPAEIRAYREEWGDLLSEEGAHLGGWHDKDTGRYVLDVSKLYDDEAAAIQAAAIGQQDGIYHLGTEAQRGGREAAYQPVTARSLAGAIGDSYGDNTSARLIRGGDDTPANSPYSFDQGSNRFHGIFDPDAPKIQATAAPNSRLILPPAVGNRTPSALVEATVNSRTVPQGLFGDAEEGLAVGGPEWYELGPIKADLEERIARGEPVFDFGTMNMLGASSSASNSVPQEISGMSLLHRFRSTGGDITGDPKRINDLFQEESGWPKRVSLMGVHGRGAAQGIDDGFTYLPDDMWGDKWKIPSYANMRMGGGGKVDVPSLFADGPIELSPGVFLGSEDADLALRLGGLDSPALDTHELRRILQLVMQNPRLARIARQEGAVEQAGKNAGRMPVRNVHDYMLLSNMYRQGADAFGLASPGAFQAARWLGGGRHTGLKSAPRGTFLDLLADQIKYTAQNLGMGDSPPVLRGLWGDVAAGRRYLLPYAGEGPVPLK